MDALIFIAGFVIGTLAGICLTLMGARYLDKWTRN